MATRTTLTTPAGLLRYPHLTEPNRKFDTAGVYETEIVIPAGDAADAFEERLHQAKQEALAFFKAKSGGKPVKMSDRFPAKRDDEGNLVVKTKIAATGESKDGRTWDNRVAIFDSKGQKMNTEGLRIGSGTRAKVAVEVSNWEKTSLGGVSISLRLRGVQIIELMEPKGGRAEDFGFGAEETGFVSETFDSFEEDREEKPQAKKPVAAAGGKVSKKAIDF